MATIQGQGRLGATDNLTVSARYSNSTEWPSLRSGGHFLPKREKTMKSSTAFLLLPIAALVAFAQPNLSSEVKLSPAERSTARAKRLIEKKPNDLRRTTHSRSPFPGALANIGREV